MIIYIYHNLLYLECINKQILINWLDNFNMVNQPIYDGNDPSGLIMSGIEKTQLPEVKIHCSAITDPEQKGVSL